LARKKRAIAVGKAKRRVLGKELAAWLRKQ